MSDECNVASGVGWRKNRVAVSQSALIREQVRYGKESSAWLWRGGGSSG